MADAEARSATHTEAWRNKPWKKFQRTVFRLQKRIYRASQRNDQNRVLVHLHCHDQVHGIRDKDDQTEEPDDSKESRPVLERQGAGRPAS